MRQHVFHSIFFLFALLLFVTLIFSGSTPATQAQSGPPPPYEEAICSFRLPDTIGIRCGILDVPLDRDDAESDLTQLVVVEILSEADIPAAEPIVIIPGRIGEEHIDQTINNLEENVLDLLDTHGALMMDPRGAGLSAPNTNCPEVEILYYQRLNRALEQDEDELLAALAIERCFERQTTAVDFSHFSPTAIAQDYLDMLAVFEVEQFHILAASESSLVAYELMRLVPDQVVSVILDAPVPADANYAADRPLMPIQALQAVADACVGECAAVFPSIVDDFVAVVDLLNLQPVVFPLRNPIDNERFDFTLDGGAFANIITRMLNDHLVVDTVPLVIQEAIQGEYLRLARTINEFVIEPLDLAEGLQLSAVCARTQDDFMTTALNFTPNAALAAAFGHYAITPFYTNRCEFWDVPPAPETAYEALNSDIPTLLLVGAFDATAPVQWTERVAATLPNSQVLEIPGAGHRTLNTDCTEQIATAFFNGGFDALDTRCLDESEFAFLTPAAAADE